ncbi:Flp family type IVb pilin [Pseudomonas helleri]|uniref:Flp family type IVb pilin n=1 Tax=Pseudomonas helleri TaxID=1608996 RepID=A0A6A7YQR0_9PSED|nr:Flp family type IVb pilin [Pseudomonas helleri]MQT33344.1 Flp family type IVb pilin [Pseudomonas helleri]MQT49035.1 Flp family type IVb pilin [Pseudomonas helleri]MQT92263.1 Flp family type IVb pilin [Pseudomonas helleri]
MFTNTVLKVYVPTQLFVAHHVKQFTKRTEGASGIEYAIIAAMVAIALAAFVTPISAAITTMFTTLKTAVTKT